MRGATVPTLSDSGHHQDDHKREKQPGESPPRTKGPTQKPLQGGGGGFRHKDGFEKYVLSNATGRLPDTAIGPRPKPGPSPLDLELGAESGEMASLY